MGVIDRAIATATKLITKNGEACEWNVAAAPVVADPTQPWISTDGDDVTQQVRIVFTSDAGSPLAKLLAGTPIESGGLKGLMTTVGFTPNDNDTVVRSDGTKLALESIRPLSPNGQIVLWFLVFKS